MSATVAIAAPSAADALTTQEKLLFAQAVYKVGAAAWTVISELLTSHPLCEMTGKTFTPGQCESIYVDLMTSIGQNVYVISTSYLLRELNIHTDPLLTP